MRVNLLRFVMQSIKNLNLKNKPIYAFVDSQNVNLAIQGAGWELDFARFRIYLKDKYKVSKAFLFIGYVPGNEALYTYLQNADYLVIFKPTLLDKDGKVLKGNVDAELVLHAMIEYKNYNKAIIVSGDGDFHCLVEYLEQKGKFLKLMVPNMYKYSALLRKFMRDIVFMNNLRNKLKSKRQLKKRH